MWVYIHLVQVSISNGPKLKSNIFKRGAQTAHGWGLAQDSERARGSYIWKPQPLKGRPLRCTQFSPALISVFVGDAEHVWETQP